MEMTLRDLVACIGETSNKMRYICNAIASDNPKSFVAMREAGRIDEDEYYQFDDRLGIMFSNDQGELCYDVVLDKNGKNSYTHYKFFFKSGRNSATITQMRDNTKFTGAIRDKWENAEQCPFAEIEVYECGAHSNFLIKPGKLLMKVEYALSFLNSHPIVVMKMIPAHVDRRQKVYAERFQRYFPAPKSVSKCFEDDGYLSKEDFKSFMDFLNNLSDDEDDLNNKM